MTKSAQTILDELVTTVHNLAPGDVGSLDRVLRPIEKARVELWAWLIAELPERLEKSSKGYPNARELEAYRNGYNKCRLACIEAINKYFGKEQ